MKIILVILLWFNVLWLLGSLEGLNVANSMLLQKYRLRIIAENIANVSTHMTDRVNPIVKKYCWLFQTKMASSSWNYGIRCAFGQ